MGMRKLNLTYFFIMMALISVSCSNDKEEVPAASEAPKAKDMDQATTTATTPADAVTASPQQNDPKPVLALTPSQNIVPPNLDWIRNIRIGNGELPAALKPGDAIPQLPRVGNTGPQNRHHTQSRFSLNDKIVEARNLLDNLNGKLTVPILESFVNQDLDLMPIIEKLENELNGLEAFMPASVELREIHQEYSEIKVVIAEAVTMLRNIINAKEDLEQIGYIFEIQDNEFKWIERTVELESGEMINWNVSLIKLGAKYHVMSNTEFNTEQRFYTMSLSTLVKKYGLAYKHLMNSESLKKWHSVNQRFKEAVRYIEATF